MMDDEYIEVGKTLKPHGIEGELKVLIQVEHVHAFFNTEAVFLLLKGKQVPFFIESIRSVNTPIVKFEDVDNRETAHEYSNRPIYMLKKDVEVIEDLSDLKYSIYINYMMIDEKEGRIGKITDILDYPEQELAQVNTEKGEIMIPMNDHFIKSIDDANRIVYVSLPEGILDIF